MELRYKGLKKLRSRLGEINIDYAENGSYELISEKEENCLNELELPGSPAYSNYFEAIDRKAGTNWKHVFEELV